MNILDRRFKYTPAAQTNADYLRAKFRRIQRQQQANEQERAVKVAPIKKAKA